MTRSYPRDREQSCAIPCVDCTILAPEATPCPTCGGSGTQIEVARMSSVAIQMRLGETSRKEYVSFKEALAERPGNVELLLRFRAWIRRALADSVVHPAWSVAFEGVAVQSADEELERLRTQVHETLRRDFEDAGRLLEA